MRFPRPGNIVERAELQTAAERGSVNIGINTLGILFKMNCDRFARSPSRVFKITFKSTVRARTYPFWVASFPEYLRELPRLRGGRHPSATSLAPSVDIADAKTHQPKRYAAR